MQIGVTFPQTEIGSDPLAIRDYAQAIEGFGYTHLLAYDHVLGADPAHRPGWQGYIHKTMFHEPFVLFGYLAAFWTGGASDAALRRTARVADGWFPQGPPDDVRRVQLDSLYGYLQEAGRDRSSLGIEPRVNAADGDLDALVRYTAQWEALGATHISLNTMNANFKSLDEHLDILRRYKDAITH